MTNVPMTNREDGFPNDEFRMTAFFEFPIPIPIPIPRFRFAEIRVKSR